MCDYHLQETEELCSQPEGNQLSAERVQLLEALLAEDGIPILE